MKGATGQLHEAGSHGAVVFALRSFRSWLENGSRDPGRNWEELAGPQNFKAVYRPQKWSRMEILDQKDRWWVMIWVWAGVWSTHTTHSTPALRYKLFPVQENILFHTLADIFFFFWGMIDWMFLSIEEFVHIAKLACQKWCNWSFYIFTYWVCNIFFLNSLFLGLWLKTSENLLLESTRSRDPGHCPPYLNQQNTFSSGFHGKELSIQRHPGNVKGTEKELRSELGGQMATVFWISCQHSSKGGQWTTYIRISWDDDG